MMPEETLPSIAQKIMLVRSLVDQARTSSIVMADQLLGRTGYGQGAGRTESPVDASAPPSGILGDMDAQLSDINVSLQELLSVLGTLRMVLLGNDVTPRGTNNAMQHEYAGPPLGSQHIQRYEEAKLSAGMMQGASVKPRF